MPKLQFRVLYREFLFSMVDLELLSAQGDMSRLLGQFAAFLVFVSTFLAMLAGACSSQLPREAHFIHAWPFEHTLIATTMLAVGLFAVLSWDSTFPNRRDVFVLAPLPVRPRTLLLAKVAASAAALSLTVISLNALPGLILPLALAPQDSAGLLGMILSLIPVRGFAAYWITIFSAAAFVFCCVLALQGAASQLLSRRRFLKVSAFLQMATFCLFLSVYFLQPSLSTPEALTAPKNQALLMWLPSYWFLGLFQLLNGSMHPAVVPLAQRAVAGFVFAIVAASTAFMLSYYRTLRKIVEEPDISPGSRSGTWLPSFGNPLKTAVVQFSIRTLMRSRQHRLILAFFWGFGFAIAVFAAKTYFAQERLHAAARHHSVPTIDLPLMFASIVMMLMATLGARVVFSMPLELRANWVFRLAPLRGGLDFSPATRRSLVVFAVAPVLLGSAVLLQPVLPWRMLAAHLVLLGLFGMFLIELCLHGFEKIPFTCSYLPGKSYVHMVLFAFVVLQFLIIVSAEYERRALLNPVFYAEWVAALSILAACARWRTTALAKRPESALQFEEQQAPALQGLGLHRDGVLPV